MDACSRTLFSVWAKRPDASGQISYDDFGEVTVSAISLACFPRMKFPADSSDQKSAKDFLLQFGLTHPIIDDMRDAKEFTAGGNVFVYLHGTVGFLLPNDALARRLSIAMAVTQRRGYLLTWFFAAPHDHELQALTDERVLFDNAPPVTVVSATKPGGEAANPAAVATANTPTGATSGAAAASVPSSANSGASAIPSAAANAANGPTANPPATAANSPVTRAPDSAASQTPSAGATNVAAATDSAGASSSADAGSASSSNSGADPSASTEQTPGDHPSLLRPGETVQQSKGAPIPKKN